MSNQPISCMNCERLGDCPTVDEQKLLSGYWCGDWRQCHEAKVAARQQILYKFGSAGASVLLAPPVDGEGGK